jgi:hypothetical protein
MILTSPCLAGEVKIPFSYVTASYATEGGPGGSLKSVTDTIRIPVVPVKGVMEVRVGQIANDMPLIPSQALVAALKAYPKSRTFHVPWNVSRVGLNFRSTVLHDRRLKTKKYFHANSSSGGKTGMHPLKSTT